MEANTPNRFDVVVSTACFRYVKCTWFIPFIGRGKFPCIRTTIIQPSKYDRHSNVVVTAESLQANGRFCIRPVLLLLSRCFYSKTNVQPGGLMFQSWSLQWWASVSCSHRAYDAEALIVSVGALLLSASFFWPLCRYTSATCRCYQILLIVWNVASMGAPRSIVGRLPTFLVVGEYDVARMWGEVFIYNFAGYRHK